jgi:hypothetical protein
LIAVRSSMQQLHLLPVGSENTSVIVRPPSPLDFLETPLGHDVIHHSSTLMTVISKITIQTKYVEAIGMSDHACTPYRPGRRDHGLAVARSSRAL